MADIIDRIKDLLEPILASRSLLLWDMEFRKEGPRWLLRAYIDREETGANLDDCEAVSRDLGAVLDVEDVIVHPFTLEVSTPGLDRALTRPEHYQKCSGSQVRIKTYQAVDGQKVLFGMLKGIDGDLVSIEIENGRTLSLRLSEIAKANLVATF